MNLKNNSKVKYDLSIIIVSYNTCSLIIKCIESIYEFSENLTIQIVVSDNASSDNTVKILETRFPDVFILKNGRNLGFAAANNRAINFAKGRFILFLNPDILLLEPVFRKMIEFLETNNNAGMVGCKLLNSDGSTQGSFFKNFPTLTNRFLDIIYMEKLFEKKNRNESSNRSAEKVAAIAGACMFMRRSLIEDLGGFDESFFMYCEDIDLSHRVHQLGYNIYFLGYLKMLHYQGESSKIKGSYFEKVLTKESVYTYFFKHYGKTKATLYKFSIAVGSIFRLLLLLTWVPFTRILGKNYNFNYYNSISKYLRVLSWGLGFEKWTKKPGY